MLEDKPSPPAWRWDFAGRQTDAGLRADREVPGAEAALRVPSRCSHTPIWDGAFGGIALG